ncbi:unnamed protein product [Psylliodes chrysocephalus]|uniref:DUF4371 domain-containing protein n=1 Tax=Psylliodes chrysocephalus TaxID=3402493 RepID=A0A9P0G789_9CUCU|nr:unnamed protein product [Psylliodes chrysocephala]
MFYRKLENGEILRRDWAIYSKSTATRELAFRDSIEKIGEDHRGNYLGAIELLSEYDPFLKYHIRRLANRGKDTVSYLSKDICDEIVGIISNEVLKKIVKQIKVNKYYSVSLDSTPDITHHDQLTIILRFCDSNVLLVERFVGFQENVRHGAKELEDTVLNILKSMEIPLKDCRGQSYDNASNMSGKYSELQTRIKARNNLAHSLNLVVQNAADCCLESTAFFMMVQEIYTFFTASSYKWNLLSQFIKVSENEKLLTNRVNTTRWLSRFDAIEALASIKIEQLSQNREEKCCES